MCACEQSTQPKKKKKEKKTPYYSNFIIIINDNNDHLRRCDLLFTGEGAFRGGPRASEIVKTGRRSIA